MTTYKFKYFDARGLGEVSRLVFALAGRDYEDVRFNKDTWPAEKPNTPLGRLPVLEILDKSGKVTAKIAESSAISRYLAREFGLYGKTNLEAAAVDEVLGVVNDAIMQMLKARFEADKTKQVELLKALMEEHLPKFTKMFETLLKKTPGTYTLGSEISLADLSLFDLFDKMDSMEFQIPEQSLKAFREAVGSNPKIKAWVAKRPVTEN